MAVICFPSARPTSLHVPTYPTHWGVHQNPFAIPLYRTIITQAGVVQSAVLMRSTASKSEKAEAQACANFWRKHAEKEGQTFTQAMQAANEHSGRIIHLFCKGHMRQQKKSSARMGFLQWSSAASVLKMHRWNKDRDASLSAQYGQQLLAWHLTSWNSVSSRARAACVYAVHEFTALKTRLKLAIVLRALKAQVLQNGHEKRVKAALERNTRLV